MTGHLNKIIQDVTEKINERKKKRSVSALLSLAKNKTLQRSDGAFEHAIHKDNITIIAEVKKASPSRGVICADFDPVLIACEYAAGGADAISVLTEEKYFQGSLEYLEMIAHVVRVPLLRKDFIIDEYQVYETAASSAQALLLIAAALDQQRLADFLALSHEYALQALVEVHNEDELNRALHSGARIIGVNNRDLTTFHIDVHTSIRLSCLIPRDIVSVSESGIHSRADVEKLSAAGYKAVLIGESLMKHRDKAAFIRELRGNRCG